MSSLVLVTAVFLASSVEMVEALTIVLAAGATRGWRCALEGTGVAIVVLVTLVAVVGVPLVHYVQLATLRVAIGALLLIFGMQWLRKAILRSSGLKAMHNEDEIYAKEVARLGALAPAGLTRDATGFAVAFKGVFLEGLEVVIIVLTLGAANHRLALAAYAGAVAVLIVGLAGIAVAKQLSSVPENAMKMAVGLMLVSFGSFWSGEGLGVHWPLADLSILGLLVLYALVTLGLVKVLARTRQRWQLAKEAR